MLKKILLLSLFLSASVIATNIWTFLDNIYSPVRYNAERNSLHASVQLRDPNLFQSLESPYKIELIEDSSGCFSAYECFKGMHEGQVREVTRRLKEGCLSSGYVGMLRNTIQAFKDNKNEVSDDNVEIVYNPNNQQIRAVQRFPSFMTIVKMDQANKIQPRVIHRELENAQEYLDFRRKTDRIVSASYCNLVRRIEQFKQKQQL